MAVSFTSQRIITLHPSTLAAILQFIVDNRRVLLSNANKNKTFIIAFTYVLFEIYKISNQTVLCQKKICFFLFAFVLFVMRLKKKNTHTHKQNHVSL